VVQKIKFLSGFPRAGNTLLSSILSQNKDITATPNSILPDIYYQLSRCKNFPIYKNFKDENSLNNVLKNIHKNYYKDIKTKYIIERASWITPCNYNFLTSYFDQPIKIVILVRDVLEIIKSYINICQSNPDFYINTMYNNLDKTTLYKTEIEEKCDIIMSKGEYVDTVLFSIKWLLNNVSTFNYIFIEYEDLIKDTEKTIKKIYDFYEIPHFKHSFKKLKQFSMNKINYDDDYLKAPIHTIRTKEIKKNNIKIELPKSVINKYSNIEFWRK